MNTYLLSIFQPDGPAPASGRLDVIMSELQTLNEEITAAGGFVFTDGLQPPSTATVVRSFDGGVEIAQGPFRQGEIHLGGLWIVRSDDRDTVVRWAGRAATATGLTVEVRPFHGERQSEP